MSLQEGQKVAYVGELNKDLHIGDEGKLLVMDGQQGHVLWSTGARAGEILFQELDDLVPLVVESREASLDEGPLVTVAVAETYARYGEVGLLNAMNDEGHLSTLTPIVEEAIQLVASRIREEPSFKEVLGKLDPEDGSEFVQFTTFALLRDAFGED